MPDDPGYAQRLATAEQQIATAEKNGNYKEAFEQARDFVYGNPSLLTSSDAAGWKDRAMQLSADLVAQGFIPPIVIGDNGIAVNADVPTVKGADGFRHVSYASGLSIDVKEFDTLEIPDPSGTQTRTFKWDSVSGQYVQDPVPPNRTAATAELVRDQNDPDQPTLLIHEDASRTVAYSGNGDMTVTHLGTDGTVLRSETVRANGMQIYTEGSPEDPERKVITYPDGTTVTVAATNERDNHGQHTSWTTTIDAPNFHGGNRLHMTLASDMTGRQLQVPASFSFEDPQSGTNYSIDNETLTLSVTPDVGDSAKYYMSGIQPEIDEASVPVVQPTATLAGPTATPVSAFGD